ncbi:MAG: PEP-CTERM sorting domain-containing protein [Armatimonadetes bacterium]|nr:PEP-CTERM sorting domain-containing protein [Armatimonadota bacterium]
MKNMFALALLALTTSAFAAPITRWDFNTYDGQGTTGTLSPALGTGSIAAIGGVSSFFGFGSGSTDPAVAAENSAWGNGNLPLQGTASGTGGYEGHVSTLGFSSITVTFDIRTQFSSSKYYQLQYQTSAVGPWNSAGTFGVANEDHWETRSTNISGLDAAANNNAQFGFRVVAVFKPGTSQYAGMSDTSGSYGRFGILSDMVTVSGQAVPEPSALLAMTIAGFALIRKRK